MLEEVWTVCRDVRHLQELEKIPLGIYRVHHKQPRPHLDLGVAALQRDVVFPESLHDPVHVGYQEAHIHEAVPVKDERGHLVWRWRIADLLRDEATHRTE